jgi:hypothetical protein
MRFTFTIALIMSCLTISLLVTSGCRETLRLQRTQIGGADPHWDLVAAPVIRRLKDAHAQALSVKGVRLNDPVDRAILLWGKPSRTYNRRLFWFDHQNNYLLGIITTQRNYKDPQTQKLSSNKVIQQIDIFAPYRDYLHPSNRDLFDIAKLTSPLWRQRIFGDTGQTQTSPLQTHYLYVKRGFRILVISKSLPIQREVTSVLSLVANHNR